MNNEKSDHPHHFLHRHVGVIKVSPVLTKCKFVNESFSRLNQRLADSWNAILIDRHFQSMPMHTRGFRKMIVHNNPDPIPFHRLYGLSWDAAVVSPTIKGLAGKKFPLG